MELLVGPSCRGVLPPTAARIPWRVMGCKPVSALALLDDETGLARQRAAPLVEATTVAFRLTPEPDARPTVLPWFWSDLPTPTEAFLLQGFVRTVLLEVPRDACDDTLGVQCAQLLSRHERLGEMDEEDMSELFARVVRGATAEPPKRLARSP